MVPGSLDVELIPWDPISEAHVERLRQQRLVCGWGVESIKTWRQQELNNEKALHWIVPTPSYHPNPNLTNSQALKPCSKKYKVLLDLHTCQSPLEEEPLLDTALISSPRKRTHSFVPIGHVSLDVARNAHVNPAHGRYGGSNLYVSLAFRGHDIARQAMEAVKILAAGFPYYGQFLVAEVPSRDSSREIERQKAFGDGGPKFSLLVWYESLGWTQKPNSNRSFTGDGSKGEDLGNGDGDA